MHFLIAQSSHSDKHAAFTNNIVAVDILLKKPN